MPQHEVFLLKSRGNCVIIYDECEHVKLRLDRPVLPSFLCKAACVRCEVLTKTCGFRKAQVKPGVVTGQALVDLLNYAKENEFAIPGVNVVSSSSVNACMEAAKKARIRVDRDRKSVRILCVCVWVFVFV